jgi:ATP/ADP translocase
MSDERFAFTRTNYLLMIGGVVVLFLGFIIMSKDTEPYGFGDLGLTIGPIVVMLGFLIQFVAIFYKDKSRKPNE